MPVRPLALPKDLITMADMLVDAFQYPDHPEWSIQSDEQTQIVATLRRMRRIWPLIRILQGISPFLRDIFRGFVFEENGAIGGSTIAQREGTTTTWYVNTVGVLPAYRRRGIARELVLATLEMVHLRGGTSATLAVIDGNTPAQSLYRSIGFVDYGCSTTYMLVPAGAVERPTLPPGYNEAPLAQFDWRTRYELDQRIVPEAWQRFEPIVPGRYRPTLLMRAFAPLLSFVMGTKVRDIVIRRARDGLVVATAGWTLSRRGEGMNRIRIRLDPACPELAPFLVRRLLHEVLTKSPKLRIGSFVPSWAPAVSAAAEEAGFVRRTTHMEMGIELENWSRGKSPRTE
jgi:ribosomal protein S18 acetylase RimI-like enzyme